MYVHIHIIVPWLFLFLLWFVCVFTRILRSYFSLRCSLLILKTLSHQTGPGQTGPWFSFGLLQVWQRFKSSLTCAVGEIQHVCLRWSLQEFNTSGSSNIDTGKASGNLETKYKMKELGLSFSQKWNTDNTLATEVTLEDQVCVCVTPVEIWPPSTRLVLTSSACLQLTQGLKVAVDTSFVPNTGWDRVRLSLTC